MCLEIESSGLNLLQSLDSNDTDWAEQLGPGIAATACSSSASCSGTAPTV